MPCSFSFPVLEKPSHQGGCLPNPKTRVVVGPGKMSSGKYIGLETLIMLEYSVLSPTMLHAFTVCIHTWALLAFREGSTAVRRFWDGTAIPRVPKPLGSDDAHVWLLACHEG